MPRSRASPVLVALGRWRATLSRLPRTRRATVGVVIAALRHDPNIGLRVFGHARNPATPVSLRLNLWKPSCGWGRKNLHLVPRSSLVSRTRSAAHETRTPGGQEIIRSKILPKRRGGGQGQFRGDFVAAVWAAVGFLEPLLDAVVSEDVLAVGQAERCLVDSLWVLDSEFVVADHTCYRREKS